MPDLRGGMIGCGFFAENHLNGWKEAQGADLVAVCDLDRAKAEAYAQQLGGAAVYTDADEMLRSAGLDFVDIVTHPDTHRGLVELCARHGMDTICQKPLAFALEDARALVAAASAAGIRFMAHENFRWQTPMRRLKAASAEIGELFFGRVEFRTAFDLYANQPYLAEDERLIVADVGVHLFDLARFFFGEMTRLYCQTQRVNPRIRGEDVATITLQTERGATCVVELSFSSRLSKEVFPQTFVHLEGAQGSAVLGPDYELTVTTPAGVTRSEVSPRKFSWTTPDMEVIQDSVAAIQQHWADCVREGRPVESTGEDNLRTLSLVEAAYQSAASGQAVDVTP